MRTTLTLDDDLETQLRKRARLLNMPSKQVVNDAIRRGYPRANLAKRPPFTAFGRSTRI
jgi:predicted transcriptional regulator